jgi:lipoprotein signal peptidase
MNGLRLLLAAVVAAGSLAADQLAKILVRTRVPSCREFPIVDCARLHLGPITLVSVQNSGTGYLRLRDPALATSLALLGCLLVLFYAVWLRRMTWVVAVGVGLQAGGALSNLLDRLLAGGVHDYVNLTSTFTFNLADIFLLLGTVLAVVSIARGVQGTGGAWPRRRRPKESDSTAAGP